MSFASRRLASVRLASVKWVSSYCQELWIERDQAALYRARFSGQCTSRSQADGAHGRIVFEDTDVSAPPRPRRLLERLRPSHFCDRSARRVDSCGAPLGVRTGLRGGTMPEAFDDRLVIVTGDNSP